MVLKRLRESGVCYAQDGSVVLSAGLFEGDSGAWEVVVQEVGGPGRTVCQFEDETAARKAMTIAFVIGGKHGQWKVHPDPAGGSTIGRQLP